MNFYHIDLFYINRKDIHFYITNYDNSIRSHIQYHYLPHLLLAVEMFIISLLVIFQAIIITTVSAFSLNDEHSRHLYRSIEISDDDSSNTQQSQARIMVMFRQPSHHTYGFIETNNNNKYDLPAVELQNLLHGHDIQFLPVDGNYDAIQTQQRNNDKEPIKRVMSRNQSKKKKKALYPQIPFMYWIQSCDETNIDEDIIANATSRAILTHATFSITISVYDISDKDWIDSIPLNCSDTTSIGDKKVLEKMDIIDTSNPNMSSDDREQLIERVACLVEKFNSELQKQIQKGGEGQQAILIHHSYTPTQQNDCIHQLHFANHLSMGPAGTKSAPSRTLRRTNRGILKKYALKSRIIENSDNKHLTSTAMEPELGLLMANMALGWMEKKKRSASRVLDPCCGSGRLLLYAAALSDTPSLVGVDSDDKVWSDAEKEFQRLVCAVPTFIHGDIQNLLSTDTLCTPDSFDAIVCDPPYNIGAPILESGNDLRPMNYHEVNDTISESSQSPEQTPSLVPFILSVADKVLVSGGRIVFFLPVRGEKDMSMPLDELLQKHLECDSLRLLKSSSRLQTFSQTFSRWLVVMEKC